MIIKITNLVQKALANHNLNYELFGDDQSKNLLIPTSDGRKHSGVGTTLCRASSPTAVAGTSNVFTMSPGERISPLTGPQ